MSVSFPFTIYKNMRYYNILNKFVTSKFLYDRKWMTSLLCLDRTLMRTDGLTLTSRYGIMIYNYHLHKRQAAGGGGGGGGGGGSCLPCPPTGYATDLVQLQLCVCIYIYEQIFFHTISFSTFISLLSLC